MSTNTKSPVVLENKESFLKDNRFWIYLVAVVVTALSGYSFTKDALKDGGWYSSIKLPSWTPKRTVFPIVWTVLFALMIAGGYLNERMETNADKRDQARLFFTMSLVFNALWSYMFFYEHDLKGAIVVTILLILSIIGFIAVAPVGRYFFIPYLLWCFFALALTINVYNLNKV